MYAAKPCLMVTSKWLNDRFNEPSGFILQLPLHDVKIDLSAPLMTGQPLCTIQVRLSGLLVFQIDNDDPLWPEIAPDIIAFVGKHANVYGRAEYDGV